MAKEIITVWTCDKCEKKSDDVDTIYWKHDRYCDAAGSMEYKVGEIDLCGECARRTLEHALEALRYEHASKLMEKLFKDKILVTQ